MPRYFRGNGDTTGSESEGNLLILSSLTLRVGYFGISPGPAGIASHAALNFPEESRRWPLKGGMFTR